MSAGVGSSVSDWNDFNRQVIDEFRANEGKVAGSFAGAPMILINHRGARTGNPYTTPLVYTRAGDGYVVIASKGGAPEDPQWFNNLRANPEVTIEVGTDTIPVRARVADGDERARLFRAQADLMPNFDEYATSTAREIPVVVLEPR